jgi:branched-chain amino acid transport system substrate-binding protein
MENLKGVVGIAGVFNFSSKDHNGLDMNAYEKLTVKDGKFVIYKK